MKYETKKQMRSRKKEAGREEDTNIIWNSDSITFHLRILITVKIFNRMPTHSWLKALWIHALFGVLLIGNETLVQGGCYRKGAGWRDFTCRSTYCQNTLVLITIHEWMQDKNASNVPFNVSN